jgi:hypothetical protein
MKKGIFLWLTLIVLGAAGVNAQVLIGGTGNPSDEPVDGALLEIRSADKGLLIPRIALSAANSAAPLTGKVAGMVVYNTGTGGLAETGVYYNDGANWVKIGSGALNEVVSAKGTGTSISGTGSSASPLKVDIDAGGVGTTQLADHAVTAAKIAAGSVTADKLDDNSVTSAKIVNGTISADDIAIGAITAAKLNTMGADSNNVLAFDGNNWAPNKISAVIQTSGGIIKSVQWSSSDNTSFPITVTYDHVDANKTIFFIHGAGNTSGVQIFPLCLKDVTNTSAQVYHRSTEKGYYSLQIVEFY